jgi:hypothetical protein
MANSQLATKDKEFDPTIRIWDKQPWETDKAFAAFSVYKDLDPHERSLIKVFEILHPNYEGKIWSSNRPYLSKLNNENRWRERVNAFDSYVNQRIEEELISRRMRARLSNANIGRVMKEKAALALALIEPVIKVVADDGEETLLPALSISEIERLAKLGSALEQIALNDPDLKKGPDVAIQINFAELRAKAQQILDGQVEAEDITRQLLDAECSS